LTSKIIFYFGAVPAGRFDLHMDSCVNGEAKVFSRKLNKQVKAYELTAHVKLDSNRDLFIKHALNMNNREIIGAKQIVCTTKYILNRKQKKQFVWHGKIVQRKQPGSGIWRRKE
jgi:hypothetical protein